MATYDLTQNIPSTIETGDILNCPYSGTYKTITLPAGTYKLLCWGAQGGDLKGYSSLYNAGRGGYSEGILTLLENTMIYVYVGGAGSHGATSVVSGGFNGGGLACSSSGRDTNSGGGGTDIRISSTSLYARVIVAGGGGGTRDAGSQNNVVNGCAAGGGTSGIGGSWYSNTSIGTGRAGGGGTQTTAGTTGNAENSETLYAATFGAGGYTSSSSTYGVGGGGGWYGGGAGSADADGGGGSGYVYTSSTASNYPSGCLLNSNYYLSGARTVAGNTSFPSTSGSTETGHSSNGYIRITVIEIANQEPEIIEPTEDGIYNFSYIGKKVQTATLQPGSYKLECWGASGGNTTYSSYVGIGGKGGYSTGILTIDTQTTIYARVGGQGTLDSSSYAISPGGFNGGGASSNYSTSYLAASGGGGTDIRIGEDSLYSRVIVAGGGGGSGVYSSYPGTGGYGGGISGGQGSTSYSGYGVGTGGTQTSGGTYSNSSGGYSVAGTFGVGGYKTSGNSGYSGGGGGGGWYGGGPGHGYSSCGGGGSGYVYTESTSSNYPSGCLLNSSYYLTEAETKAGNIFIPSTSGSSELGHEGNGYARITPVEPIEQSEEESSEYFLPEPEQETEGGSEGTIYNFSYTGNVQFMTLSPGTYKFECWGALGGSRDSTWIGGKGGYSVGVLKLIQSLTIYIYVGGVGKNNGIGGARVAGGFNGGGYGCGESSSWYSISGGGASDIRIGQNSLYARIIVAGGGGGSCAYSSTSYQSVGGYGGGSSGGTNGQSSSSNDYASGGTLTSGGISEKSYASRHNLTGSFGEGDGANSSTTTMIVSGGGGGWYGGGCGVLYSAGGGSGYVYTSSTASNYPSGCLLNSSMYLTDAQTISGDTSFPSTSGSTETGHSGNGYVRITAFLRSKTKTLVYNFPYTGVSKHVILPKGTYKFECWGALGGYRSSSSYGGKGGYSVGKLTLSLNIDAYIYVGGSGNTGGPQGGFNGGGVKHTYNGGGGASDIRIGQDSLYARIIVAGGGGSDGGASYAGSYGGGTNGGDSSGGCGTVYSRYGTQTGVSGGSSYLASQKYTSSNPTTSASTYAGFGFGGAGAYYANGYGGAGGGGWYGGGGCYPDGSGDDDRGGCGGSGYVYTSSTYSNYPSGCLLNSNYYLTDASTTAGNASMPSTSGSTETGHTGDGYIRITRYVKYNSFHIKVSNDVVEVSKTLVKVSDSWKEVKDIYTKVNGKWIN